MSHSHHEAPRELVAVLWSIAGLLAVFLALSVSSLFILKYYFPVSADTAGIATKTVAGKCTEGSEVAINNFPGSTAISSNISGTSDDKTSEVVKPLGGVFQCSSVCVSTLAPGTTIDSAAKTKISEYFTGGSIGGKPIIIANTGNDFMKKVLEWQKETNTSKKDFLGQDLQRTIITSSNKSSCAGPNSRDYVGEIVAKGKVVPITKENTTVEDTAKAAAAAQQAAATAAQVNAGSSGEIQPDTPAQGAAVTSFKAPAGGSGSGSGTQGATEDIATCKTKINDFIEKYQKIMDMATQNESDPNITRFNEIKNDYVALKKEPYITNDEKASAECQRIEKLVVAMDNKLWGSKTELAQCKKDVKMFLNDYGQNKVTQPAYGYYQQVDTWYKHITTNPYYLVSAERQMKLCKPAKELIQEYKVATGTLEGPAPATTDQKNQYARDQFVSTQMQRLAAIRGQNINYHITGQVFWNQAASQVSKKAVICIGNTKSLKDGSAGAVTRKQADSNGNFDISHTFNADMLGDRGIVIYMYDPGGWYTAKAVLFVSNATEFNTKVSQQMVDKPGTEVTGTFGNVDLQKGYGGSKALRDQFVALTGSHCN